MSDSRAIWYFVPGTQEPVLSIQRAIAVSDESRLTDIIKDAHQLVGADAVPWGSARVAYLPAEVATKAGAFRNHSDWFTVVSPHIQYPEETEKILSLELCEDQSCQTVQFLICLGPDQLEFRLPGGDPESDHERVILHARTTTFRPSSVANEVLEFRRYQEEEPIYNGRPATHTGPPITIYEKVFADVAHSLTHLDELPDNEDTLNKIGDLIVAALKIYKSEAKREKHSTHSLNLSSASMFTVEGDTHSDAVAMEGGAIYLHIKCKNELGVGGMGDLQTALTLLEHISTTQYTPIHNKTRCPCIHLCISGPYILFAGSILVDIYCFQPFTHFIHLGGESFMTEGVFTIAKIFDVFRNALSELKDSYVQLQYHDPDTKDPLHLFPNPTYLSSARPISQGLVFEQRFTPNTSYHLALFLARLSDRQQVIVTFCKRYNPDAHRAMEKAPKLLFHARLRGGGHMVVMEYIQDEKDAHLEFRKQKLPDDVVRQVEAAITGLRRVDPGAGVD